MSGGSWYYLYSWDIGKVLDNPEPLAGMATRLMALNEPVASRLMEDYYLLVKTCKMRLEARHAHLRDIMHALEWHDSYDIGPEQLRQDIQKTLDKP
jgi:hypothetical protein